MLILNVLVFGVSILALSRPEAIGEWIVNLYEDITSDIGHTVPGMYAKLLLIASVSSCLALVASTILCEISCVYVCKCCNAESEEAESNDSEETMAKLTKEEKANLKKERRAARLARKVAKAAAKGALAAVAEAKVEAPKSKEEEFLASLRKK